MTGRRLTELSFEDWIEHVFSHEVPTYHAAWYFDVEADWWDGPPALTISYITRLFSDPDPPLTYFADSQIAQGLTYLIDSGAGDQMSALSQVSVPLEVRITCVESINRTSAFSRCAGAHGRCWPSSTHAPTLPGAG